MRVMFVVEVSALSIGGLQDGSIYIVTHMHTIDMVQYLFIYCLLN